MKKAFTLIELLVVIVIIAILAAILFPVFTKIKEEGRATACASNLKQIALAFKGYLADHQSYTPAVEWENPTNDRGDPTGWKAHYRWVKALNIDKKVLHCPSEQTTSGLSYGFNRFLWSWKPGCNILKNADGSINWPGSSTVRTISETPTDGDTRINYPTKVVTFFDWRSNDPNDPECPSDIEDRREGWPTFSPSGMTSSRRHNNGANYAFWDGHVERLAPKHIKADSQGGGGTDTYNVGYATVMPWYKNNEPWYDPGLRNGSPAEHGYACDPWRGVTGSAPAGTWATFNIFR